jgi:hypothetical protein
MYLNKNNTYKAINYLHKVNNHFWTKKYYNNNLRLRLTFRKGYGYLFVDISDVGEMLQKEKVNDDDLPLVQNKIDEILTPIFNPEFRAVDQLKVKTIDYKLDIPCTVFEKIDYMNVVVKSRDKSYTAVKKLNKDDKGILTGVQFKNKTAKICMYDKGREMEAHPEKFRPYLENILRFEIRLFKSAIIKNKKLGIEPTLENYFREEMRYKSFKDYFIGRFVYNGELYNLKTANKQLSNGSNLEKKIKEMLKSLSENDVNYIIDKYAHVTIKKYIDYLENLNINPVTISNMEYLRGFDSLLKPTSIQEERSLKSTVTR